MKRRDVLRATGSAMAGLALAGCLDSGPGNGASPTDPPTESPTVSPSATPTPTETPDWQVGETAIEVLSSKCGSAENVATIGYADGIVTVEGTIGGSDTCDTAKLESVAFEEGTLRIVVKADRREMTGTPACGQCLTDIEYEATAETGSPAPETVVVEHVSMGETREVARTSP